MWLELLRKQMSPEENKTRLLNADGHICAIAMSLCQSMALVTP